MAFISLAVSSVHGRGLNRTEKSRDVSSFKPPNTSARPAPKMVFSSIDAPETAVTLAEMSVESKSNVITAAYKHVFGNAYIMEFEQAELAKAESEFKMGTLSTREFIRALGKSEAYRKRFFARSGPYRFVELNFKHFMGRGPNSQEEVSFHVQKLLNEGYDAEIDSYIDSEEFDERFGESSVPRFVFEGEYLRNDNFNRMTIMRKFWDGCSTSTVSGSTAPGKPIPAQLTMGHGGYVTGYTGMLKGLPAGFRPTYTAPPTPKTTNPNAGVRTRIKIAENLYQVVEEPGVLAKEKYPEWKKELVGVKRWNGVWY